MLIRKSPQSEKVQLWECSWWSNCCGCSGFILFTAPRKLHNLPHIHNDKEFLNKSLDLLQLIGRKGRRTTTESPRVCTSGLRRGFCGPEPEPRPELGDHVSWNKQSDCEAMSVPVNWKPCKQTRFCQSNPETSTSCFENLETATSRFAAPEVKGPRAVSLKAIVDALF